MQRTSAVAWTLVAGWLVAGVPAAWGDFPDPSAANLPPRTLIRPPEDLPLPDWLGTNLRIGHLPGYNERMVAKYLASGYNVITVNCLGTWDRVGPSASLYPEDEVRRADAYLRNVVDKVHAGGARSVLYIGPVQVPVFSKEFSAAHPDWLKVKPDGSVDPNFGNIRGGYGDWLCAQLEHVAREYRPDGFWFDGYAPAHLHTYDAETRRLFREFSGGAEIPTEFKPAEDPVARRYLAWHEQFFVDFADRMRRAVRRANSEAALFVNYSANRTWYFPDMYMGEYPAAYPRAIDVSSVELYWDVPGDALYQQFCCAFVQGVTRKRAGTVWIQPREHGISGVSSPIEIQLRGLEGSIWGIYPEFVESTGREEYLRLHADNIKEREPFWKDTEPVPYIGLVASEQTRTLYARGALPVYFSHTLGAFRALFEWHWPVRVLTEYDLEDADLGGVKVVVLPNVACLSDRAVEVIRRFVDQGGGLVASHETSLYDDQFRRRADFALSDLFGAHFVRAHSVQTRSEALAVRRAAEHPITDDPVIRSKQATAWQGGLGPPPERGDLSLVAGTVAVDAAADATVLMTHELGQPVGEASPRPAALARAHGSGRVVYLPAGFDKAMFFYPDGYIRQLLVNSCRWAAGDTPPPVEVSGPLILATTFRRQSAKAEDIAPAAAGPAPPCRVIVHLLNDHGSYGRHSIYQKLAPLPEDLRKQWGFPNQSELQGTWPIREEIIPLSDIVVTCRVPGIKRATLEPEHRELELRPVEGGVAASVPRLHMHSMVVFE